LICDVDDCNQSEIEYTEESVPGKSFAQKPWEAKNFVLRNFDDLLHKNEDQSARHWACYDDTQFLSDIPESIFECDLVPGNANLRYRAIETL
jgi:hypothetical protein